MRARARRDRSRSHHRRGRGALALLLAVGVMIGGAETAWAYWFDDVNVSGTTVTASVLPAPTAGTCTLGDSFQIPPLIGAVYYASLTVGVTTANDPRFSYFVQLYNRNSDGSNGSAFGSANAMTIAGTTASYKYTASDFTTAAADTHITLNAQAYAQLIGSPSWVSTPLTVVFNSDRSTGFLGLAAGEYFGCGAFAG